MVEGLFRSPVGTVTCLTNMSSQPPSSQPPPGFFYLVLLSGSVPFYLENSSAIVATERLRPRSTYGTLVLGWYFLGVKGALKGEQRNEFLLNGELVDQGVYRYLVQGENVLA